VMVLATLCNGLRIYFLRRLGFLGPTRINEFFVRARGALFGWRSAAPQ
jgi:hypothetical protein